jgi:hypothetical protein
LRKRLFQREVRDAIRKVDRRTRQIPFAPKEDRPAWIAEGVVHVLQQSATSGRFQTHEKDRIGEVVAPTLNVAAGATICSDDATGGLVVATECAFSIYADAHPQGHEVVDRMRSVAAERGTHETEDAAL